MQRLHADAAVHPDGAVVGQAELVLLLEVDDGGSSEPVHLSHNHRATLAKIFQHPVSHNLEWNDVRSLFEAIAVVEDKRDGKISIVLNDHSDTLERPKHKNLDAQEVLDLRHLLEEAGFEAPAE